MVKQFPFCSVLIVTCVQLLIAESAWLQASPQSEGVKVAAQEASKHVNDQSVSNYYKKLVHIHSASVNVDGAVHLMEYNVTYDVGTTICRRNELEEDIRFQCVLDTGMVIDRCWSIVLETSWFKLVQVLETQCRPFLPYSEYFNEVNTRSESKIHYAQ